MNSLVKVFSNFKEFYSEINGATLTGAIDVVVVEQPDGSFLCSPFHVRFGKLGVLRSREKVVDIEINGEPVDIHMKLGESGEAFFVEECSDEDEDLPENLATSPIPRSEFANYEECANEFVKEPEIIIPIPRRNSIDLSKESEQIEAEKKFENQMSDFSHRRYTDNGFERPNLTEVQKEYTTQKLRKEWAEREETIHNLENLEDKENINITKDTQIFRPIMETVTTEESVNNRDDEKNETKDDKLSGKDELKSKKKRRKKSAKKKNSTRKNSTSSSAGSVHSEQPEIDHDTLTAINNAGEQSSSTEESPISDETNDTAKEANIKEEDSISMNKSRYRELDIHFFSDTEVGNTTSSPQGSRPSSPIQSDTEFEVSQREKDTNVMTNSASWKWGELPTHPDDIKENITDDSKQAQRNSMLSGMFSFMKQSKKLRKNVSEGLYLSDLNDEGMDPEVAALYLGPATRKSLAKSHAEMQQHQNNEEDRESGNGTSLPQSPNSMEAAKNSDSDYEEGKITDKFADIVAMSLCGGLENGGPSDADFDRHLIQYSDVCQDPSIFSSPNLVIRLNGRYFSWAAACPMVMTMITFQKTLPNDVVEVLMDRKLKPENIPSTQASSTINQQNSQGSYYRFFGGLLRRQNKSESSATPVLSSQIQTKDPLTPTTATPLGNELIPPVNTGTQTSRTNSPDLKSDVASGNKENQSAPIPVLGSDAVELFDKSQDNSLVKNSNDKFRKTLRLSTQQIELLSLKDGMNEVVFSVTTAYQGTTRCKCYLFKWKHNDKVVISDIDGTITKSDVLGHLLPMVGKDWAQIGVAQLFSKIEENGYKLLYLSARAIGQSRATREYLRSIRQGDVKLPDGPLLLNPTSLISAFHREVIERKPEQFKIACLSDIKMLFPDKNPFYAGYGNRINDVWAYTAVGIPIMRIFTINTKGELKHELTQTFQSTYCSMAYIVDQLFPPVRNEDEEPAAMEFSNFNYWRDPVCDIENFLEEINSGDEPLTANLSSKTLTSIPEN